MYFVRQPEQFGLGHAVLCMERVIGNDLITIILLVICRIATARVQRLIWLMSMTKKPNHN